jgi:hypothetical protein
MEQPMTRNEFLRKAIHCLITPSKKHNVSAGEGKHILEQFAGSYVSREEFVELMTAEGFSFYQTGVFNSGYFQASYRCNVAALLNHQWSREYIRSHFGRRTFEKWDSVCDAIVVLKHMCLSSHGKFNVGNVDTAVSDILNDRNNALIPESDPVAV